MTNFRQTESKCVMNLIYKYKYIKYLNFKKIDQTAMLNNKLCLLKKKKGLLGRRFPDLN